jgi:pimeloyl-ACP methyl ester carboxylesterase
MFKADHVRETRMPRLHWAAWLIAALFCLPALSVRAAEPVVLVERIISHVSNVPAIAGRKSDLYLREKAPASVIDRRDTKPLAGRVVLFIHGGYVPSTLAFDVPSRDYSWMNVLARAGYDAFAMDLTGYGHSTRPLMDDPCNLEPRQQTVLIPRTLQQPCPNKYPFELVNTDSETADIGAVVDYIRKLRGVDRVTLIGWAGGAMRAGVYASRHPEAVDRMIFHASSNYDRNAPGKPPAELPQPGVPMTMQTREVGETQRWLSTVVCGEEQIEPGIPDILWKLNLDADPLGATWGPGGLRAPTRTYWGWNAKAATKIKIPVLIMIGEQDQLMAPNLTLFEDLGSDSKMFLTVACASHFMGWEKQSRVLHRASLEWLQKSQIANHRTGKLRADETGKITPVP